MPEYIVDKSALLVLMRRDCETVFHFYLGESITLDIPDFHHELWDELMELVDKVNHPDQLVGILQKLLGVPRGHAKTTIIKLAIIIFLRYSRLSFCAYLSNTLPVALAAVKDVVNWFLSEKEIELYGKPTVVRRSDSDAEYQLRICIPGHERQKLIILQAFGYGTQVRGRLVDNKRPDLMILDDTESRETTSTVAQQAKFDAWAFGDARKAMAATGVCIFIGNMISKTSLLARLAKDSSWNPTVFGCIIRYNGKLRALWEGMWTLNRLLVDYKDYRDKGLGHVWEAEMMNLTAEEIFGESLAEAIRVPRPQPDELIAGFICLDPAFGVNAWNDESAITVHVRMLGGDIPILAETIAGRWREDRLFDEMVSASYRWGLTTWIIEAQAAQKLLIPLFRSFLTMRGMSPELFLMIPILATKDSKASRIIAWRSSVAHKSYAIAEEEQETLELLEKYSVDSNEPDDRVDSGAYGIVVWDLHGNLIQGKGRQDVAGLIMGNVGGDSVRNSIEMGVP